MLDKRNNNTNIHSLDISLIPIFIFDKRFALQMLLKQTIFSTKRHKYHQVPMFKGALPLLNFAKLMYF